MEGTVRRTAVITLMLLPLLIVDALANALPAYIAADPGPELAVDAGCPIVVEHEDLVFDLSDDTGFSAPTAKVTASYVMKNPTGGSLAVMMAFPYVVKLYDADPDVKPFRVTVDGTEPDHEIYYGRRIKSEEDLRNTDFDDVLSNVILELPPEPEDGIVYRLVVDKASVPDGPERILVRMSMDETDGRCFTDGFSGGTFRADGTFRLEEWFYPGDEDPRSMSVFVSGGSLKKYTMAAYESYNSKEPIADVVIDAVEGPAAFREYVIECFDDQRLYSGLEFGEKEYWVLIDELGRKDIDSSFGGVIRVSELLDRMMFEPRLAGGVFFVNFEPGSTRTVTVDSFVDPSIRRPARSLDVSERYTYNYLSSPAKNWAGFGTLDIRVIPPEREMVPVESEPLLEPDGEGAYTAKLDGLPPENIRFTFARKRRDLYHIIRGDWPVITFIVIISAAMVIFFLRTRKTRKLKSS
jgi:hypothetical protein